MYIDENYTGQWYWPNFTIDELKCKCGCGTLKVCDTSLDKLQNIRDALGPLKLTSAYRCPEHNNKVSSTGLKGPHTSGHAFDIKCSGTQAIDILKEGLYQQFNRVGISQKGEHSKRFIHLDDMPNKPFWIWSY